MNQRAAIERNAQQGTDPHGHPLPPEWEAHKEGVPCRVWSNSRRHVVDGEKEVVIEEVQGIFPHDADVTELDRITSVKDRRDNVLWPGPLEILTLAPRKHHRHAQLRRVGG